MIAAIPETDEDNDQERFPAVFDADATRRFWRISGTAQELIHLLDLPAVSGNAKRKQAKWGLEKIRNLTADFAQHEGLVCWLCGIEKPDGAAIGKNAETTLCAIPKDIDARLRRNLWRKGFPIVLTFGTLSADGDSSHIKRTLGLKHAES